ncbi:hypothetical protein [Salinimicrobium sp. HB62]|uniref:hypothetical protein n=1 Tax=Salinimicrobium sp. HB62 TaxID=3077781 RepID=UPI002D784597|nr:hypothetical protein [Salinimicrobium sp. HB62]
MRFLFFISFTLIQSALFAQSSSGIQDDYDEIFHIKKENYEGREYLRSWVKELDREHPLSGLVNNNKVFLEYWLTNFTDREAYQQLMEIEKEEELQEEFTGFLKRDPQFDHLMTALSKKVENRSVVADTVSVDQLLNVAVKYFNILGITAEGSYKGKVCAGLNGITETLSERKPELEAFCFSAILKNLQGEEFNMYNEFVAAIKELYKQELGVDREARLLRAQGAMFSLMRNNEQLREMLISEYEKRKHYLPFVLDHSAQPKKI